jgi:HPr kinase/phosphorylase
MRSGVDAVNIILHGTAVAIGDHGVLLTGPSGAGKSDMAVRLIDRGALLISDDAVVVQNVEGLPWLAAAPNIEGKIEVRGVGICAMRVTKKAPLRLVAQLVDAVERMPEAAFTQIGAFDVPLVKLAPFEISAAIKLELALRSVVDAGWSPVPIDGIILNESGRA